jgi:hypothetical protein
MFGEISRRNCGLTDDRPFGQDKPDSSRLRMIGKLFAYAEYGRGGQQPR